jgi:hypothetical protein
MTSALLMLAIGCASTKQGGTGPDDEHDAATADPGTGGAGGDETGGSGPTGGAAGGHSGGAGGDSSGGRGGSSGSGGAAGDDGPSGGAGGTGEAGSGGGGAGGSSGRPDAGQKVDTGTGKADASSAGPDAPAMAGCTLRWSPSAARDGKDAFEGLEMPDTNGVHPGAVHFSTVAQHDAFRIDQHDNPPGAIDYDHKVMDRLRCEVKGMKEAGVNLQLLEGETWRIAWSLLIPATLKGSTRFNHIWQMKYVDTAGGSSDGPVLTLDLTGTGAAEKIRLDVFGVSSFTGVAASGLHDKWLSTEVTVKIAGNNAGSVRWKISDDSGKVLSDTTKTGLTTFPAGASRLRPKWGIYRSLGDTSGGLQTTYILISDLLGYRCP